MPPRRASAASSAKRAAEDLTDEAGDAKRRKADGAPMAASAVAAPAAAAAAAAAASSSSAEVAAAAAAASSPSPRSDVALAAAIPLPDSLDCPICDESFPAAECKEEGGAERVPRSLPCPKLHTYCTKCLEQLVKRGVDKDGKLRTFVICSLCQFEHELQPKQPPTSAAAAAAAAASAVASEPTDAELVRLIPINALLMDAIGHKRQLTRMVCEQQQQLQDCGGATRCTYPSCAQPALFWCEECEGELCAAHDRDLHPEAAAAAAAAPSSSAAHRRIPLSERTSARHAKMAARLAANGGKIRDAFFGFKRRTINRAASLSAHLDAEIVRVERDVLGPIRAEIALNSAADLAVKTVSAEIAPLSDVELLKHESRINQLIGAALPREGLLAELSAERLSDLKRFLRTAGVSLDRIHGLVYRGSRDGFHRKDFVRMCTGCGDTLTLIKVKDNNYVFGAFIRCAWPADDDIVADPSGQSFIFSLVNAADQAVRFSLKDKDHAIELIATSVRFGAGKSEDDRQTGWPNVVMMFNGLAADQEDANVANPIEAVTAYQSDDAYGQECDHTFLAGQQQFAAAEIEVFQL